MKVASAGKIKGKKCEPPPLLQSERVALFTAAPMPDHTDQQSLALLREYAGRDGVMIADSNIMSGWRGVRRERAAEGLAAAASGTVAAMTAAAGPSSGSASRSVSSSPGSSAAEPQPSPKRTCSACGVTQGQGGARLKLCSACRVVYFCSVQCQRQAWPEHRKVCGK